MLDRRVLYFSGKETVALHDEPLLPPARGEVSVRSRLSAISAGTELLFYRGRVAEGVAADTSLDVLTQPVQYPLSYGYAVVGVVEAAGEAVPREWIGRRVFAFAPHADRFNGPIEALLPIPPSVSDEDALFLPNMETAIGLVHDGAPLLGERTVVTGLGVVGLLVVGLLATSRTVRVTGVDHLALRRRWALELGADHALDPGDPALTVAAGENAPAGGADLCIEVSGNPAALDLAIALAGYTGRIVVGSWYGEREQVLRLGARFHRFKQTLLSSQVSHIAPGLSGRWSKMRRFELAWEAIEQLRPARLITHRFDIASAGDAFALLAGRDPEALQVVFTYP
ncbi:MAG: zinc-binding dehydrogenase [Rhodothermales bacterium]